MFPSMSSEVAARPPATLGVPPEVGNGERRVSLVPKVVERLRTKGVEVVVESGAGLGALIPDELYTAAGATVGDPWSCSVVEEVPPPTPEDIGRLASGTTDVGVLAP